MTESTPTAAAGGDRSDAVLNSALTTFARFGYRKTSMDGIARNARISRPGLYFLFSSKDELFRAAVVRGLDGDLAEVERILEERDRPVDQRMLEAFDQWAGRYIGPMSRDIAAVIDDNPELLGDIVVSRPQRFGELVTNALEASGLSATNAAALAQTLVSTSIGIKHQVQDRETYRERLAVAIALLRADR